MRKSLVLTEKKFAVVATILFLIVVLLSPTCSPVSATSFADEAYYEIAYFFNDKQIYVANVSAATPLTNFIDYDSLAPFADISAFSGKALVFTDKETGEKLSLPYTIYKNTSIEVSLEETDKTVNFTFFYGVNSKIVNTYPLGSTPTLPDKLGGYPVLKNRLYSDNGFSALASFPKFASTDFSCYPVLDKQFEVKFNDVDYTLNYGDSLKAVLGTQTHAIPRFFTDKEMTSEYGFSAVLESSVLYGKPIRTHYSVTFENGSESTIIYVPVDNPVVTEQMFPKTYSVVEWRFDEAKKVPFPITLTDDVVLYSSNGLNNPLTTVDKVLLYVAGAVLLGMAVWGGVYEYLKKKRNSFKPNPPEIDAPEQSDLLSADKNDKNSKNPNK